MKLIIKKETAADKKPHRRDLILSILVFAAVAVFVYLVAAAINGKIQQGNLANFNAQAAAYGNQLTAELAANSSTCQQQNVINATKANMVCGSVFYCSYSSACQAQLPNLPSSTISILCDAFKSNRVIATGMCFKI